MPSRKGFRRLLLCPACPPKTKRTNSSGPECDDAGAAPEAFVAFVAFVVNGRTIFTGRRARNARPALSDPVTFPAYFSSPGAP
jgi:hypothetical protein